MELDRYDRAILRLLQQDARITNTLLASRVSLSESACLRRVRALYPEGHPYHHTVIGSMNDLNAASLEDVKTWFRSWYGPNNAVLVLAGDIDLATAKQKAAEFFGDIPAKKLPPKPQVRLRAVQPASFTVDTDQPSGTLMIATRTPGPPPPCGIQKVLCKLRWQTSAPMSPGRQSPTCAFMFAPSM